MNINDKPILIKVSLLKLTQSIFGYCCKYIHIR